MDGIDDYPNAKARRAALLPVATEWVDTAIEAYARQKNEAMYDEALQTLEEKGKQTLKQKDKQGKQVDMATEDGELNDLTLEQEPSGSEYEDDLDEGSVNLVMTGSGRSAWKAAGLAKRNKIGKWYGVG